MNKWYKFLTEEDKKKYYLSIRQLEGLFKVFHLSSELLGDSEDTGVFEFTPRIPKSPLSGEDNFTRRISLAPNINRAIFALDGLIIRNQTQFKLTAMSGIANKYYVYAGDLKSDSSDDINTIKLNVELKRCKKDLSYTNIEGKFTSYTDYSWEKKAEPWTFRKYVNGLKRKFFGTDDCASLPSGSKEEQKCLKMSRYGYGPADFDLLGMPEEKQKFYACVPDAYDTKEEWSLDSATLYYVGKLDIDKKMVEIDENSLNLIKSKLRKGRIKEKPNTFK